MTNEKSRHTRHSWATRALHMLLALAVIWQLLTSLAMEGPRAGVPGDWVFSAHSLAGRVTLGIIVLFWLNLLVRRIGVAPGALFPWLSAPRRTALYADARRQVDALRRFRAPQHIDGAALASAVHGLGLLLVTVMAATGALWWLLQPSAAASFLIDVHTLFANLAWVYLIGHAGLAILYHLRGEAPLGTMWSGMY